MSKIETLKQKLLEKESKVQITNLTRVVNLMKQLGIGGEIIGREFEVYDKNGELVYTIIQKPFLVNQINVLENELKILAELEKEEYEKSSKKNKVYNKGNSIKHR
jgi:hypothetical protein